MSVSTEGARRSGGEQLGIVTLTPAADAQTADGFRRETGPDATAAVYNRGAPESHAAQAARRGQMWRGGSQLGGREVICGLQAAAVDDALKISSVV